MRVPTANLQPIVGEEVTDAALTDPIHGMIGIAEPAPIRVGLLPGQLMEIIGANG